MQSIGYEPTENINEHIIIVFLESHILSKALQYQDRILGEDHLSSTNSMNANQNHYSNVMAYKKMPE